MKSLSEILLEKLRVSRNYISKPELIGRNIVSCTMEFFFKWIMVLDPNKPLTQADFEDFEVLEDDHLQSAFKTYENLFNWYEDNKDETIEVTVTGSLEEYKNIFFYDGIKFWFYSGDNLIDATK
jgi:hypothetical protein